MNTTKSALRPHSLLVPNFFLLAALLAAPSPASAEEWRGSGRIEGIVVDINEKPVPGAEITLRWLGPYGYQPPTAERAREIEERGPAPLTTDEEGRWVAHMLTRGLWRVVARHPGFGKASGRVRVYSKANWGPHGRQVRIVLPRSRAAALRDLLQDGDRLLAANDPSEARRHLEPALSLLDDPTDRSVILTSIARAYYLERDMPAALGRLREAVDLAPGNLEATQVLSELLLAQGEADEALEIADRLVRTNPDLPVAWLRRAKANLALGQRNEAREDLREILQLEPDGPSADQARQYLAALGPIGTGEQ